MMKFIELLFFHIYKSQINSGETGMPVSSAVLGLSFILFMNILSIVIIVDLLGVNILSRIESMSTAFAIILGFIVFGLNLFWFYYKKKYKRVIKELSKRSERQRKIGARITLFYSITSILAVFILAPLRII